MARDAAGVLHKAFELVLHDFNEGICAGFVKLLHLRVRNGDCGLEFAFHDRFGKRLLVDEVAVSFGRQAHRFELAVKRIFAGRQFFGFFGEFVGHLLGLGFVAVDGAVEENLGDDEPIEQLRFAESPLRFGDGFAARGEIRFMLDESFLKAALANREAFATRDYRIVEEGLGGKGGDSRGYQAQKHKNIPLTPALSPKLQGRERRQSLTWYSPSPFPKGRGPG